MVDHLGNRSRLGVDAVLVAGRMVEGDASTVGGRIGEVGLPSDGSGYLAVAGYVDHQVNGFAGVDFALADVEGYHKAASAMAATGVTTFQPTFISLPWETYEPVLAVAAEALVTTPGMVGVHLEGPFLSPAKQGAHDPANFREATSDLVGWIVSHPQVSWVTVAPEVRGVMEAIQVFVRGGVRVSIGHSDATVEMARAAIDAGAVAVNHLFNAQSGLHHRRPGIPGAALDDARVSVALIVDGRHLAPEVVRLVFKVASNRVFLTTDAIAAAGVSAPGRTGLGGRRIEVSGDRAHLGDGTLAGSLLTMDRAVRNVVDLGLSAVTALRSATETPARLLGRPSLGDMQPGSVADIVVLDTDYRVVRTLRGGREVFHR